MAQMMLDPSGPMQKAYYDVLNGAVSVPVYDAVPANAQGSYIVLGEETVLENGVKDALLFEFTQTVVCVVKMPKDARGKKQAKALGTEVGRIVNNKNGTPLAPAGFSVVTTVLEFAQTFEEPGEVEFIYRHAMRFRHLVEQTAVS